MTNLKTEPPVYVRYINGKTWYTCMVAHEVLDGDSELFRNREGDRWCNVHGYFHRVDGPAVELNNEITQWYIGGLLHRLDGPAVESLLDGVDCVIYGWYVNGIECFDFKDFQKAGKLTDDQITILRLKYGEIS